MGIVVISLCDLLTSRYYINNNNNNMYNGNKGLHSEYHTLFRLNPILKIRIGIQINQ